MRLRAKKTHIINNNNKHYYCYYNGLYQFSKTSFSSQKNDKPLFFSLGFPLSIKFYPNINRVTQQLLPFPSNTHELRQKEKKINASFCLKLRRPCCSTCCVLCGMDCQHFAFSVCLTSYSEKNSRGASYSRVLF